MPPAPSRATTAPNVTRLWQILTAILLATTLLFGWMAFAPDNAPIKTGPTQVAQGAQADKEITDTAARFTKNLLSYRYTTVDRDVKRALRDTTQEFKTRKLEVLGGIDINKFASEVKASKATGQVDVKGAAITSQDDTTATVLVVTYRTFESTRRKDIGRGLLVMEMTLRQAEDGWKVDNLANPARPNQGAA